MSLPGTGPGDQDMIRFYFPGGDFICYSRGSLDLVADLFDANGKKLGRDSGNCPYIFIVRRVHWA